MPTYEYRCSGCGRKFKLVATIREHEAAKPRCPKCGSRKVAGIPGRIFAVTSKKS